jgi:hypothetical protein
VLWVSVSSDLRVDAARDLDDIFLASSPLMPVWPSRESKTGSVPVGNLEKGGVGDGCAPSRWAWVTGVLCRDLRLTFHAGCCSSPTRCSSPAEPRAPA